MSYGHVEISTKVFLMIFMVAVIITGVVVWWATTVIGEMFRTAGVG